MRREALMMVLGVSLLAACKRDDMADQARVKTLGVNALYANGAAARLPPANTIAVNGKGAGDDLSWEHPTGATHFPFEMTRNDLLRGQRQFSINCTPCHGLIGDGQGMIPERGFTRPPSFHTDRLRNAPPSYYYNVMTKGIGAMFPASARVTPDDRWRIAAYIKALQLSQYASTEGGAP